MLQVVYILAFTIIAFLAITNLFRNLINIGREQRRGNGFGQGYPNQTTKSSRITPHPELLDEKGQPVNEPLLVMRSVSLDDARQKLDQIYKSSPGGENRETEE